MEIFSCCPFQDIIEELTEDGYVTRLSDYMICAETERGERYVLMGVTFDDANKADAFARKVQARGKINPALWYESDPAYATDAFLDRVDEATPYRRALTDGWIHEEDVPEYLTGYL